ncbi:MAG TPA: thymidine phosphorylase family protein [Burkholderiales bacterium]|nr:thymidine phosphorylase family protein [Burkholderiales bacterium]
MLKAAPKRGASGLRLRRIGIDTYGEPVLYMRSNSEICRAEGFAAQARVEVTVANRSLVCTLHHTVNGLLQENEVALSESAWRVLDAHEGSAATLAHPRPLESLSHLRAKVYGNRLGQEGWDAMVRDIAAGRYSELHLASFVTACAGAKLDLDETEYLTRAMLSVGSRIEWPAGVVADKHCVGGLPGNRTTLIVVPILAACGALIPKTSSRAITSPAGTADVMEVLAPVDLTLGAMRSVVDREGGCVVWGGNVQLSPADDILIRVERPLDFDSEAQLVASVLSKKAAAGSTHVLIDIPVGETAKVRDEASAKRLAEVLTVIGARIGIAVKAVFSDGTAPVGRGMGPALEARDVMAVLRGSPTAPVDLRDRALHLAAALLEFCGVAEAGQGMSLASATLNSGQALRKFERICEAQGGLRNIPGGRLSHVVVADRSGFVIGFHNRRLARVAKLAGAPRAVTAGIDVHVGLRSEVVVGMPLFTLWAETPGELQYALNYFEAIPCPVTVGEIR